MADQSYVNVKNTLLLAFVLFTFLAITFWNVTWDNHVFRIVNNKVGWYPQYTGLWQNWAMFSPDPISFSLHVKIVGIAEKEEFVYEPEYGYGSIRRKKLFETIVLHDKQFLPYYLGYWCNKLKTKNVTHIKLLAKKQPIALLGGTPVKKAEYEEISEIAC